MSLIAQASAIKKLAQKIIKEFYFRINLNKPKNS